MAVIQPYVVHPSTTQTAAEIAALYGLSEGEYIPANQFTEPAHTWHQYIHLYERDDGAYRNIKQELGDTGTYEYVDKIVKRKNRDGRYPNNDR